MAMVHVWLMDENMDEEFNKNNDEIINIEFVV